MPPKRSKSVPAKKSRLTKKQKRTRKKQQKRVKKVTKTFFNWPKQKGPKPSVRVQKAAPVAIAYETKKTRPLINHGRGFTISNTEYLEDIAGTIAFNIISPYQLNPGLTDSFPWLGQMGAIFEEYVFNSIMFFFKPTCSSSVAGTIMLVTDYDPRDDAFTDKASLMSYTGAQDGQAWTHHRHNVVCKNKPYQKYFTRVGAQPSDTDIRLYDYGNFYYATQGFANTNVVGELYVSYSVTFYKPKILAAEAAGWAFSATNTGKNRLTWGDNLTALYKHLPNQLYPDQSTINDRFPLFEFVGNALWFYRTGYFFYELFFGLSSGTITGLPIEDLTDCVAVDTPLGLIQGGGSYLFWSNVVLTLAPAAYAAYNINSYTGTPAIDMHTKVFSVASLAFNHWFLQAKVEKSKWTPRGKKALIARAKRDGAPREFIIRCEALPTIDPVSSLDHAKVEEKQDRKIQFISRIGADSPSDDGEHVSIPDIEDLHLDPKALAVLRRLRYPIPPETEVRPPERRSASAGRAAEKV